MLNMAPKSSVSVWIPVYKSKLRAEELLSLWQVVKKLSSDYRCVLAGKMRDYAFLQRLKSALGDVEIFTLPNAVFQSVSSYCDLLLSPRFYNLFDTSHVLVAQLDSWICGSISHEFLRYDYIAPRFYPFPHKDSLADARCIGVGVGGLSLRCCRSHIIALNQGFRLYERNIKRKKLNLYSQKGKVALVAKIAMARLLNLFARFPSATAELTAMGVNEDWVLGIFCSNRMKIAPRHMALCFGVDGYFSEQFDELGERQPFGLHGWYRDNAAISQCRHLIVKTIVPGWEQFLLSHGAIPEVNGGLDALLDALCDQ